MTTLNNLPVKEIALSDLPNYFRITNIPGAARDNTFIQCGSVRRGGNEPYCFTEEKQCSGHVCRVLSPEKVIESALVIRDDGTVWKICLSCFEQVELLKVI